MNKLFPTTHLSLNIVLSILLHFFYPVDQIISGPYKFIGLIFIFIGILLNIWADFIFKEYHTSVRPDKQPKVLIKTGPFRFSRHPMYLGMTLMLVGLGFVLGSLASFSGSIIFFLTMNFIFVPQEEKTMEDIFNEYKNYKKKVRQWI
jgi:protein-S-isoprenylcysteine O-methyltransferase Ste14